MVTTTDFLHSLSKYLLIFIIPIFLYLKLHDKVNPLIYLKIIGNSKKGILIGIINCSIYIILLIAKKSIYGFDSINLNIGLLWISGLLVGLLEEIPFRGFLLQKLAEHMSFWKANILTTIIFILNHISIWMNSDVNIMKSAVSISLVSLVLGYLFKEYKSLWIPIICHSVFNLCIWIGL